MDPPSEIPIQEKSLTRADINSPSRGKKPLAHSDPPLNKSAWSGRDRAPPRAIAENAAPLGTPSVPSSTIRRRNPAIPDAQAPFFAQTPARDPYRHLGLLPPVRPFKLRRAFKKSSPYLKETFAALRSRRFVSIPIAFLPQAASAKANSTRISSRRSLSLPFPAVPVHKSARPRI